MAIDEREGHDAPSWFVAPGDADSYAWVSLVLVCLALYGLVTLYAAFDRWAEHKSKGTPLAKTIPTILAIALLYEIFPLEHFNILLPISAILIAMMVDWSRFSLRSDQGGEPETGMVLAPAAPEPPDDTEVALAAAAPTPPNEIGPVVVIGSDEAKDV